MNLEYNTQREQLTLREYGRNVQNLVKFIRSVDDKEKRNKYAALLVDLMKMINPELNKDATEYNQKVWDDLFIISHFNLDVESPFPIPEATILDRKPDRMGYQSNEIKYRHYGRSVEILIENASKLEDPKEKEGAVITIGRLMKTFYQTWNKDTIEDEQILKTIRQLSNDQLDIDIEKVKEFNLFDSERKEKTHDSRGGGGHNRNRKGGGKRNFNNKRRRSN
ncbi:MAG: DUF4290 domain-containing protein [Bacteroidota bacterium]